jgi:hypothetical protein
MSLAIFHPANHLTVSSAQTSTFGSHSFLRPYKLVLSRLEYDKLRQFAHPCRNTLCIVFLMGCGNGKMIIFHTAERRAGSLCRTRRLSKRFSFIVFCSSRSVLIYLNTRPLSIVPFLLWQVTRDAAMILIAIANFLIVHIENNEKLNRDICRTFQFECEIITLPE